MLIAARNSVTKRGIPYTAEVEYLESTGTQWIDTGIDYFPDFEIGIVCPTSNAINALGIDALNRLTRRSSANPYWQVVAGGSSAISTFPLTTYADISYRSGTLRINGEMFGSQANSFPTGALYLFTSAHNLPTAYAAKLYYFRAYDSNNVLVRDFIPVRVGSGSSAVGYLYDRANPTGGPLGNGLYGNAGTGAFVLGPDKTSSGGGGVGI